MEWMLMPYRRYADFSGRSRRKEYWMFTLLSVIITVFFYGLMAAGGGADMLLSPELGGAGLGPLFWVGAIGLCLWALASIVPSIAVTVRRLHDRNLTGWIYLGLIVAQFIPLIGLIAAIGMLVLMVLPGNVGANKYGADPKDPGQAEVFA